jgi:hypothetical protein
MKEERTKQKNRRAFALCLRTSLGEIAHCVFVEAIHPDLSAMAQKRTVITGSCLYLSITYTHAQFGAQRALRGAITMLAVRLPSSRRRSPDRSAGAPAIYYSHHSVRRLWEDA